MFGLSRNVRCEVDDGRSVREDAAARLDDASGRVLALAMAAREAGVKAQERLAAALDGALSKVSGGSSKAWKALPFSPSEPTPLEKGKAGLFGLVGAGKGAAKASAKTVKGIDLPDVSKLALPVAAAGKLDLPMPSFSLPGRSKPRFDLPTPSAPKLKLPEVEMPRLTLPRPVLERICPPPKRFTIPGLVLGAAIGALVMFLADPVAGARRRKLIADKAGKWFRIGRREATGTAKHLRNQAQGAFHEVRRHAPGLAGDRGEAWQSDGELRTTTFREAPANGPFRAGARDESGFRGGERVGGPPGEATRSGSTVGEASLHGTRQAAMPGTTPAVTPHTANAGEPGDGSLAYQSRATSTEPTARATTTSEFAVPPAGQVAPEPPAGHLEARPDQDVLRDVEAALLADPVTQATATTNIQSTVVDGRVTLRGLVPNLVVQREAAEIAARVPGVRSVINELEIGRQA